MTMFIIAASRHSSLHAWPWDKVKNIGSLDGMGRQGTCKHLQQLRPCNFAGLHISDWPKGKACSSKAEPAQPVPDNYRADFNTSFPRSSTDYCAMTTGQGSYLSTCLIVHCLRMGAFTFVVRDQEGPTPALDNEVLLARLDTCVHRHSQVTRNTDSTLPQLAGVLIGHAAIKTPRQQLRCQSLAARWEAL